MTIRQTFTPCLWFDGRVEDAERSRRAMEAMMQMQKLDLKKVKTAHAGH